MSIPRVKICCISSIEEAQMAISHGASALGLVGAMPSGPGVIDDSTIATIAQFSPPGVDTFLLTQETTTAEIITHAQRTNPRTIQLVDAVPLSTYDELRIALPGIKLVQVIHVIDQKAIEEAQAVSPLVDAILLDSGNPHLAVKELGGTGRTHNWAISAALCKAVDTPVFLAGGLQPGNIREAIETVRPFGVDLCSGVRTHGHLDPKKLCLFFKEIHAITAHPNA